MCWESFFVPMSGAYARDMFYATAGNYLSRYRNIQIGELGGFDELEELGAILSSLNESSGMVLRLEDPEAYNEYLEIQAQRHDWETAAAFGFVPSSFETVPTVQEALEGLETTLSEPKDKPTFIMVMTDKQKEEFPWKLYVQEEPKADPIDTCPICGGNPGHYVNCPNGIAFSKYPEDFGSPLPLPCSNCLKTDRTLRKCRNCEDYLCQDCEPNHLCYPDDCGDVSGDIADFTDGETPQQYTEEQHRRMVQDWDKYYDGQDLPEV